MRDDISSNTYSAANSDISYIKSIILKSEINYRVFKNFFLMLAIVNLISNVFVRPVLNGLLQKLLQSTMEQRMIVYVAGPLSLCAWKFFSLILILMTISIFYVQVKENNQGISLWLFEIQTFILIFCDGILPLITVIVSASDEAAELFSVVAASMLLLLVGILSDSRGLRTFSYFYTAIPLLLLTITGMPAFYYSFAADAMASSSALYIKVMLILKYIVYEICPIVSYAVLTYYMYTKEKQVAANEL